MSELLPGSANPARQDDATRSASLDEKPITGRGSSQSSDAELYASGAVIVPPATGIAYPRMALGPGNEAMGGGASPAPRSLTGGAMGKYVAGLSPSFPDAARGVPAPGGPDLYTSAELSATFAEGAHTVPPEAAP